MIAALQVATSCVWCLADERDTDRPALEYGTDLLHVAGTHLAICDRHVEEYHAHALDAYEADEQGRYL